MPAGQRIEWIAAAVSALAFATLLGLLLAQDGTGAEAVPRLSIVALPVDPAAPEQLPFEVRNDGGRTASAVSVALRGAGTRRAVIEFIPPHSRVSGAFLRAPGAREAAPELTVESYLEP